MSAEIKDIDTPEVEITELLRLQAGDLFRFTAEGRAPSSDSNGTVVPAYTAFGNTYKVIEVTPSQHIKCRRLPEGIDGAEAYYSGFSVVAKADKNE